MGGSKILNHLFVYNIGKITDNVTVNNNKVVILKGYCLHEQFNIIFHRLYTLTNSDFLPSTSHHSLL